MPSRRPLTTTGNERYDAQIDTLLDEIAPVDDRDLLRELLVEGVLLAEVDVDRLDLKIATSALREMREAFEAFAPVRGRRKITIFGSARTEADDPLYAQARDLAKLLAQDGWMVVTGAGPGIMLAAMEGAGRADSFGVRIRLPFENEANEVIAGDTKLVSMKYFFTRKLMLMKESSAYIAMPGGFGTLDETFELLTLQQTGKAIPAPVVLLDVPGGTYWQGWRTFVADQVAGQGYIGPDDLRLAPLTDDIREALAHIDRFYANYRSIRWVGDRLVIRVVKAPDATQLAELNDRFAELTIDGAGLSVTEPLPVEVADRDELDHARVVLRLDPMRNARLHELIDALNDLA
jgi:uncharacterized protein (TIGR00730 family)